MHVTIFCVWTNQGNCEIGQWKHGTCPSNWDYFIFFSELYHYIYGGNNLLLSRSPFQHHIIRCPQILCCISKGCIWTSWKLCPCWPSRSFLEITLPDSKIVDYLQIKILKLNSQISKIIVVPTVFYLSKQNTPQIIQRRFGHVSISRIKRMARRWLMEGLPENLPDLEYPWPIFFLNKETENFRGPTIYASTPPPKFMLQMDFAF